jgi:hypothetical protein
MASRDQHAGHGSAARVEDAATHRRRRLCSGGHRQEKSKDNTYQSHDNSPNLRY